MIKNLHKKKDKKNRRWIFWFIWSNYWIKIGEIKVCLRDIEIKILLQSINRFFFVFRGLQGPALKSVEFSKETKTKNLKFKKKSQTKNWFYIIFVQLFSRTVTNIEKVEIGKAISFPRFNFFLFFKKEISTLLVK